MKGGAIWLRVTPILIFSTLVFAPLILGLTRLIAVAEMSPFEAIGQIDSRPSGNGAIAFSFIEATISAIFTLAFGIPIAWSLARHKWPAHPYIKATFTMPFVMPSIVAAVGFLVLIGSDGPLVAIGIDLRQENGIIGNIANQTGWANPGHFIALIAAHVWFNLALVIRFLEPPLANLDPSLEQSLKLLPAGKTMFGGVRNLWLPLLMPNIAAAAILTFIFSFTSFALVRWLAPSSFTLERVMAEHGGAAGIEGYGIGDAQMVLGSAVVQMITILFALVILNYLQQKRSVVTHYNSRIGYLKTSPLLEKGLISKIKTGYFFLILAFVIAPVAAVVRGSFRIRIRSGDSGFSEEWTFAGWRALQSLSWNQMTIYEALINSLGYAALTLLIALPLGMAFTLVIFEGEEKSRFADSVVKKKLWSYWSAGNDLLVMLPLAISAVLIGLGISLGLLHTWPELSQTWWFPVIGHILIATPFVVRSLLPAIRSINPDYSRAAALLGLNQFEKWWKITLPLLSGPVIVASSLALAISLGEFGASWVVMRNSSSSSLPIHIDALFAKPGFDPLVLPTAMAGASVLLALVLFLYIMVEKYRPEGSGGEF